jgi:hypothetical protein
MNLKIYLINLPIGRAVSSIAVLSLVLCMSMLPGIATASSANNETTTLEDDQALQSASADNNIIVQDNLTIYDCEIYLSLTHYYQLPWMPHEIVTWKLISPSGEVIAIINHADCVDGKLVLTSDFDEDIAISGHVYLVDDQLELISDSGGVIGTMEEDVIWTDPSYMDYPYVIKCSINVGCGPFGVMPYPVGLGSDC